MKDWQVLLAAPRFRAYWLALLCDNVGSWCVIASLPILVAERYGAGMVLVFSMGLRIIPKVLLAPLASGLLRRFGPARVASSAMLAMAVLTALLPWCENLILLQVLIGGIGTLDLFINPGLLSLRSAVTPPGLSMQGNTMCSVADRAGKVAGPALGGLLVTFGFAAGFAVFGALIALSAIPVVRLSVPGRDTGPARSGDLAGFVRLIRTDRQIGGLLIAAVVYMVMLGGLRPFLFWANRDWFGASDTAWTGLLVAQGAGALIGAIVSAVFVGRLLRRMSAYTLTLVTGIMEGAIHLLLLFARTSTEAILILALAGIPEIISTAAWFTAYQARLPPVQQAVFFTFAAPLWDLFFALGIASAALHADGLVSLSAYWAMVSLTATLPLIPLLMVPLVTRRDLR
jgi:predicted MFS family arabinose efflux permease